MATGDGKMKMTKGKGTLSREQIISGFQDLRNSQRGTASKISELEMERKEHDLVIEALHDIEPDRKCYRMVGNVLVERQVKEVLPALQGNTKQIGNVLEMMTKQLEEKGKEINAYRQMYNIQVRGEEDQGSHKEKEGKPTTSSVLVAGDAS